MVEAASGRFFMPTDACYSLYALGMNSRWVARWEARAQRGDAKDRGHAGAKPARKAHFIRRRSKMRTTSSGCKMSGEGRARRSPAWRLGCLQRL